MHNKSGMPVCADGIILGPHFEVTILAPPSIRWHHILCAAQYAMICLCVSLSFCSLLPDKPFGSAYDLLFVEPARVTAL
jgi:hypothetical protein